MSDYQRPFLSVRETQMLSLHLGGKRIKEIALLTSLKQSTISTYLHRLRGKFGVQTNAELAIKAALFGPQEYRLVQNAKISLAYICGEDAMNQLDHLTKDNKDRFRRNILEIVAKREHSILLIDHLSTVLKFIAYYGQDFKTGYYHPQNRVVGEPGEQGGQECCNKETFCLEKDLFGSGKHPDDPPGCS